MPSGGATIGASPHACPWGPGHRRRCAAPPRVGYGRWARRGERRSGASRAPPCAATTRRPEPRARRSQPRTIAAELAGVDQGEDSRPPARTSSSAVARRGRARRPPAEGATTDHRGRARRRRPGRHHGPPRPATELADVDQGEDSSPPARTSSSAIAAAAELAAELAGLLLIDLELGVAAAAVRKFTVATPQRRGHRGGESNRCSQRRNPLPRATTSTRAAAGTTRGNVVRTRATSTRAVAEPRPASSAAGWTPSVLG